MKVRIGAAVLSLLLLPAPVLAAPRHFEGAVTLYQKDHNQVVVCTVSSPELCNMLRLYDGTKIVSSATGKETSLAQGEYVSVDTQPQSGQSVATRIQVYPDRIVRAIEHFEASKSSAVSTSLLKLKGVSKVMVNPTLGEALIQFNPKITSPEKIQKGAARVHLSLTLPG